MRIEVGWLSEDKVVIEDKYKDTRLARKIARWCLEELGVKKGVKIKIKSEIPVGCGLGSSAALATGIVWGMMKDNSEGIRNKIVKRAEDFMHGKSSGVDQAIVREGGVLRFQKDRGFEVFKVPNTTEVRNPWTFILVDSGKPVETTGEMVKMVAKGSYEEEFKRMANIVENFKPELIRENQRLLEKIGVVGERARKMVRKIEKVGGVAKICGGGGVKEGSGALLVYGFEIDKVKELVNERDWRSYQVKLGAEGVRNES